MFRSAVVPQEEKSNATQAYKAAQEAEREKMARLRALRLARDATTQTKPARRRGWGRR
jgi:hypothetical protein